MSSSRKLVKKIKNQAIAKPEDIKVPDWVPEKEDTGTAMLEASQEMLLVVADVLIRFFGFDDPMKFKKLAKDLLKTGDAPSLKQFHDKLNYILSGVAEYEEYGPDIISPASVKQVGNIVSRIAETRLKKNLLKREGKEYPMLMGAFSLVDEIEGLTEEKIIDASRMLEESKKEIEGEIIKE